MSVFRRVLMLWTIGLGACSHHPQVKYPTTCLTQEPPTRPSLNQEPTNCPPGLSCWTKDEDRIVERYIRALERYARDAFTRCGPVPKKDVTGPST